VDEEDVVSAWISLPRRIYLDASTLQTVYDYGEVIWEAEPFEPIGRAAKVQGLAEEVDALRMIFLVNQRAMFEFVVTEASLREVEMRGRPTGSSRCRARRRPIACSSAGQEPQVPGVTFDDRRFGNISRKDRRLYQDALDVGCGAFMTMERRLPSAAKFIQRTTRLRVMRPTTYWHLLDPWAALYY
jgi:hypothetical protein